MSTDPIVICGGERDGADDCPSFAWDFSDSNSDGRVRDQATAAGWLCDQAANRDYCPACSAKRAKETTNAKAAD